MSKAKNSQFEETVLADLNDLIYLYREIPTDKLQAYVDHNLDFGRYYFNGVNLVFEIESYRILISSSRYKVVVDGLHPDSVTSYDLKHEKFKFIRKHSDLWYFVLRVKEVLQGYDKRL